MKKIINSGQSVIEYFIIFSVILAVVLSTGIISPNGGRIRQGFQSYFDQSTEYMR